MTPRQTSILVAGVVSVSTITLVSVMVWKQWYNTNTDRRNQLNQDANNEEEIGEVIDDDVPISVVNWNEADVQNQVEHEAQNQQRRILTPNTITIVHGSMTGTTSKLANELYNDIKKEQHQRQQQQQQGGSYTSATVQLGCINDYDWWDELINNDDEEGENEATASNTTIHNNNVHQKQQRSPPILVVLLPTYTSGSWTTNSINLYTALQEIQTDWRISSKPLGKAQLQVAIYGTGSSEYNDGTMGLPAKQAVSLFQQLGSKILVKCCIGDDSIGTDITDTFHTIFKRNLFHRLFVITTDQQRMIKKEQQYLNKKKSTTTQTTVSTISMTNTTTNVTKTSDGCVNQCQEHAPMGDPNHQQNIKNDAQCCQQQPQSINSPGSCCNHEQNTTTTAIVEHDFNNEHGDYDIKNDDEDYFDENDDEDDNDDEEDYDDDDEDNDQSREPQVMDLEDIGDAIVATKRQQQMDDNNKDGPREMVTPSQAKALQKEGYKLIGTHSAVKLCRWTKHQLRGRGGCYKHTFYGITSYQCMEATPSLACANKCVFCWRHHKNPVGKEWKWKTDDPYYIVDEAVQTHVKMIKETRGIPGVQLDRWREAHTVKHCALSLVGEPIMYPRIDELLGELHNRHISTFLVTNGQHPTAIASIRPITQLYVSVDAPTEKSLIAIDRPLFNDAWDRLRLSLSSLKDKGQRTVARLTVVKGWNSDEISGYAELIALGRVSLVEVKGVTFCGKSDASNLNMTNTPWHHEVVELTRTLQQELVNMRITNPTIPEYDIACEHKHSCSVLLARVDQFATDGYDSNTGQRKWRTWIDYDKFQLLAKKHTEDPSFTFSVTDYTAPTPDWAIAGAKEEGFDPTDRRYRKQTKYPKYTQFDLDGVPTHDENHHEISTSERTRLRSIMQEKKRQIGDGSTVTELRGGEKEVLDASLMFRGLVVAK